MTLDSDQPGAELASKLALLDELRLAEIRATSCQVASVIAHMIGTPLNVIVGRAALLRANPNPDSMVDNARRIEEQAQRLTQRVQRLIHYLTAPEPAHQARPTRAVVEDAMALYLPIAQEHRIGLQSPRTAIPDIEVEGTPALMVVSALLSLAIRTARDGQMVELGVKEGVLFSVWVPGMSAPRGRIDRMDPPEDYEPEDVEREQLLAVCAAIAKRNGGRLDALIHPEKDGVTIQFQCAAAREPSAEPDDLRAQQRSWHD
jgi:two-component system, NtrC family, sensor kinase